MQMVWHYYKTGQPGSAATANLRNGLADQIMFFRYQTRQTSRKIGRDKKRFSTLGQSFQASHNLHHRTIQTKPDEEAFPSLSLGKSGFLAATLGAREKLEVAVKFVFGYSQLSSSAASCPTRRGEDRRGSIKVWVWGNCRFCNRGRHLYGAHHG